MPIKSPSRTLQLKIVSSGIGLFGFGHGPSELEQLEVLLDGSAQQHSGFGFSRGRHSRLDLCQHPQHPQSNRAKYESEECEIVPYSVNLNICVVVGVFGCTTTTNIDESISLRPIESEGHPDASSIQAAPGKVGKKDPMSELLHWAGNSQFRDGWFGSIGAKWAERSSGY